MMLYADAIRRQAEAAPRTVLPAVTQALWKALAEEKVTEAEAEELYALIEAQQFKTARLADLRSPVSGAESKEGHTDQPTPQERHNNPRKGVGSRPRTSTSLVRRRRWAASGRLPPVIAAWFSLGEQAALSLIAAETVHKGDCRLSISHIAAMAGVSETTVRNAVREAGKLCLLEVKLRPVDYCRNDTNVVRIVSPEWLSWLKLGKKGAPSRFSLGRHGAENQDLTTQTEAADHNPHPGVGANLRSGLLQGF